MRSTDISSSEKSVHSISIRLPSALDQDDADDGDSANDSSAENSQNDESKAVNVPGFSMDDLEGTGVQTETAVSGNDSGKRGMEIYSDDFDDSYRFESTGEQELASIKSSDGSARASHHSPLSDQHSPSVLSRDEAQRSHSSASSYRTAMSVESSGGSKGRDADAVSKTSTATSKSSKFSGSVGSKYPTSVLSIPQPQMSANSPVPLARRSTAKSVAFKHGSESQPPKPKPRHSLERTTSSISNTSLLAPDLTLSGNSSAVNTSELRPDSSDDYQPDGNYSDDFDSDDT
ncbi:uncharacterized protein [Diadema antillarum]|uniref:uncharacterized protein n=1 Tax=Diadema antillarum TaxID=105358 RepID=UPI003A87E474